MGNVKRGKGTKLMVASDHAGFPLAVHTAAALLDAHLAAVGIDMITEHRSNRKHPAIIGLAQKG